MQFLVLLLCALYGLFFAFGKIALEYTQPFFFTGIRMCFSGILLLGYMFLFHKDKIVIKKNHLWPLFWIGVTSVYFSNAYEFWGLKYLEAGKACFIYSFSPVFTAFISYFYFHEKVNLKQIIGLTISIVGFMPLLITTSSEQEDISGTIGLFSYAEVALIIAAIATSIGWVLMCGLVKKSNLNVFVANGVSMFIGGLISLGHSVLVEDWSPLPISDYKWFVIWVVILIINSNIMSNNLHAFLFKYYTATYVDLATLSSTFFAAFFGWLLLGEVLSWVFWASLFSVIAGLYIYFGEELKKSRARPRSRPRKI